MEAFDDRDVTVQISHVGQQSVVILRQGLTIRPVPFDRCKRLQTVEDVARFLSVLDGDFETWVQHTQCGNTISCRTCYLQVRCVSEVLKIWLRDHYKSYVDSMVCVSTK